MNETGKNRVDLWLPIAATVVLFRVLIVLVERKRKVVLLIVLIAWAVWPWKIQVKTTACAMQWDKGPEQAGKETVIRQPPGVNSSTRADTGPGTPRE